MQSDLSECTDLKNHNYLNLSNNLVNSNKSEYCQHRKRDEGYREQLDEQSVLWEFFICVRLLRNTGHDKGTGGGDRCEAGNSSADNDYGDKL